MAALAILSAATCDARGDRQPTTPGVDGVNGWAGGEGGGWEGEEEGDPQDPCEDTPLVLSFDGSSVEYVQTLDDAHFDFGQASSYTTYWPTSATPWLARDLDGSGTIDDAGELFGSDTILQSGEKASDGFQAIAELDLDGDQRVDAAELGAGNVLIWRDTDYDRISAAAELTSAAAKVSWIDLPSSGSGPTVAPPTEPVCDVHGNCETGWAELAYVDDDGEELSGLVIDITLPFIKRASDPGAGGGGAGGGWAEEEDDCPCLAVCP